MKQLIFIASVAVLLIACNNEGNEQKGANASSTQGIKQLNISILLDLSDRISPKKGPDATKNDVENIKTITEFFKANMLSLGAYNAKGKIRVFFSPPPDSPDINAVVSKLNIDCSKLDNKGRKVVYDSLTGVYEKKLYNIYANTISTKIADKDWVGADIWRFFKDDVSDYCIEKDANYRNILVIFTDGYLYHPQSYFSDGNRYTYLTRSVLNKYRKPSWKQLVNKDDFGIITERNDLQNLEVLVLGVKSELSVNKVDEDILRYLWGKWFDEMNISHHQEYPSDLPANTRTRILSFFQEN